MLDAQKLTISQLAFSRENQCFFKNLNAELHPGEILQIRGENGSGKSTLLRILAGLLAPEEGQIYWNQQCILKENDAYKKVIRYLGHRNALKSYLSVHENLKLAEALQSQGISLEKIMEECHIGHLQKKQVEQLSAGQLRRVSFAKILLNPGKIWILDEPLTALDQQGQAWLTALFAAHLQKNGLIIIATHQNLMLENPIKTISLGESNLALT